MIHKYNLLGNNICLDVHSGAVHILDDISYKMLDYLDENMTENIPDSVIEAMSGEYSEEDLTETYNDLYELYKMGQLFSDDDYEKFANLMKGAPVKSMCLNVAHDCNLRCEYCFAAKGDFGKGRCLMPLEIGKKAPHKLSATLKDMAQTFGNRRVSIVRELTKVHEEVIRTTLPEAYEKYGDGSLKGEIVLVIEGAPIIEEKEMTLEDAVSFAKELMESGSKPSEAAKKASELSGIKKADIYKEIV